MKLLNLALIVSMLAPLIPQAAQAQWGRDRNTYHGPPARVEVPPPGFPAPRFPSPTYPPTRVYVPPPPVYIPPVQSRWPDRQWPSNRWPERRWPTYRTYEPSGWRTGRWSHERHDNRLGWWWVSALGWQLFNAPTYPYPEYSTNYSTTTYTPSQTTVIYESPQLMPSTRVEIMPTTGPATPPAPTYASNEPISGPFPGTVSPPNDGRFYFCESSQLYYPRARTCSERWRVVPVGEVD